MIRRKKTRSKLARKAYALNVEIHDLIAEMIAARDYDAMAVLHGNYYLDNDEDPDSYNIAKHFQMIEEILDAEDNKQEEVINRYI